MKKRIKYYHLYGNAVDCFGENHVVTVVGKLEQATARINVVDGLRVKVSKTSVVDGMLVYPLKTLRKKLTIGMAICHPTDEFDEEYGVRIAKSRIKDGRDIGSIYTDDITMLTEDAIMSELLVKLQHVIENIDNYIPVEE